MTCIVAIAKGGKVYMGADSAGVAGLYLTLRRDPKIYRVGEMLLGFTSSFRMGQLLGYKLTPPDHAADCSVEKYMNTLFIDAVRETLKSGGWAQVDKNQETGGTFLVGYRGRIFRIDSDFQVGEHCVPYDAVGCGAEVALGSVYSTSGYVDPVTRLEVALAAAELFSAGVRGPWVIDSV